MSQKTDNLIKLALVFFVSLLSFSIGTYVGKKYSDNQHKLALLEPQNEAPVKTTEEFAMDSGAEAEVENQLATAPNETAVHTSGAGEKPAALTDSEVAKIAEEFASEEEEEEERIVSSTEPTGKLIATIPEQPRVNGQITSPKATTLTAMPAKTASPAKTVTAMPAPKQIAKNDPDALPPKIVAKTAPATNETVTPTPTDAEFRNPASIPPTTEMVPIHYTVQIGSFPSESEANTLTKSLQNKGYKTSYVPARVNGQTWYRVNVGLFGTIREAQDYKKEFLEKTKMSSAIVQRVQH